MPPLPGEEEAAGSPPADGNGVAPASPPASGEPAGQPAGEQQQSSAPAGGQTAGDGKPKSVLDAVLKGLEKKDVPAAPTAPAAATGDDTAAPAGEKAPDGTEKPVEKMLGREGQERIRELAGKVKTLEPKARYFDEMTAWVKDNGLASQDVQYALNLIAAVKNNPAGAAKLLEPIVARVKQFTGDELPADLREQVDSGAVSEAAARELAARRAGDNLRREQMSRAEQQTRERQAQEQVERHALSIGSAVSAWERDWQSKDPDYTRKQKFVSARIAELMQTEGNPESPDAAVELAKRARKDVEDSMAGFVQPARPSNPPTGGATRRALSAPTSSLEAAKRGLENARAA